MWSYGNGFVRNVVVLSVDNASSFHSNNKVIIIALM